jgi:transcriptional regulator GlxA family with amidase domain
MPAGLFAASDMARACNQRSGRLRMAVSWVGATTQPVHTHHGPPLRAQATLHESVCDAYLLPGLWLAATHELEGALAAQRPLVEALHALPARVPTWSYCAGVALAAEAGRLDRRSATATWWLRPALATRFGHVQWRSGAELVVDRQAVTASGPSGYLPLMLDRLAQHFDGEVLLDVQELLMLPSPRRRHPSFDAVDMMRLDDTEMRSLLAWAQTMPAEALTLAAAAQQLKVSVRTLARRVDRASGMGAGEWLRLAKLSQAAEALRSTRAPIKTVCDSLGFGSEASLYRAFRQATGMTPTAYRQAYGTAARGDATPRGRT